MANPLKTIMNPKSVVIAGASNDFRKMGAIQAINLLFSGYEGDIVFLHPKEKTVLQRDAYPTAADLPFVPELALLITPTKVTPKVLDELGKIGVRHAVIITAGFKEIGEDGIDLDKELMKSANKHGIRFVGPNCIGIFNSHAKFNVTVLPYLDKPGKLGLISQSGTYVAQSLPYLRDMGIGMSQAISIGNASSIDIVDGIEHLGDDPNTKAIALYIEGIKRGRKFIEVARKVSRKKPIVALYVGGSEAGSRSVKSHTASMGGSDELYNGIFEQAGIIRAATIGELYGWGNALANMPIPKGNRMAILTHSGGPASSMADTCERNGLLMPELSEELQSKIKPLIEHTASAKNPVDLTFTIEYKAMIEAIPELLFNSDEIDGVLLHGVMDTGFVADMYENLKHLVPVTLEQMLSTMEYNLERILALPKETNKPFTTSNFLYKDHAAETFRKNGIPIFRTPEEAVRAMYALVKYGEIQKKFASLNDFNAGDEAGNLASENSEIVNEFEAKELLAKYDVPVVKEQIVKSIGDAKTFAKTVEFPIVMKGLTRGVAHKSEAGLVKLDIWNDEAIEKAWNELEQASSGCEKLVSKMLKGERELVVGMTRDATFGTTIMLGIGGVFTEAIKDVTFRATPITKDEAIDMIDSLKNKKLFKALRGYREVDKETLAKILLAISDIAKDHPEITEIDINPLVVVDGSPVAVDAMMVRTS